MTITNALASVAVSDLTKSVKWYQRLFGRLPDCTPLPEVAEWKFERPPCWNRSRSGIRTNRSGRPRSSAARHAASGHENMAVVDQRHDHPDFVAADHGSR